MLNAHILLILILSFASNSTYFELKQPLRTEIENIERQFDSEQYQLDRNYISENLFSNSSLFELEQPIMYIRKEEKFPVESLVYYYFTCDDTVRFITHKWGTSPNEYIQIRDMKTKGIQDLTVWDSKFNELSDEISSQLGSPIGVSDFKTKSSNRFGSWKQKSFKWTTYENTTYITLDWYQSTVKHENKTKVINSFGLVTETFWNEEKSNTICIVNKGS